MNSTDNFSNQDIIDSVTWFFSLSEEVQHEYITKYFNSTPLYTPKMIANAHAIVKYEELCDTACNWFSKLKLSDRNEIFNFDVNAETVTVKISEIVNKYKEHVIRA